MYIETSFVSACVTDRSDTASLYRRQSSLEWWQGPRVRHEVFVSEEVIVELSRPTYKMGARALEHIKDVHILSITDQVIGVAKILVDDHVMPGPIAGDAIHVAVAAVNRVDFMLSWNVRHLANPRKVDHLQAVCRRIGVIPPVIVTPDMMWEA